MKIIALATLSVMLGYSALGQTVASYELSAGTPLAATTSSAFVSAGAINNTGSGLSQFVPNAGVLSVTGDFAPLATTAALAVQNSQFFQFTVTPNAGAKVNLTALNFLVRKEQVSTMGWVVRSSIDNFAANLGTTDIPTGIASFTPIGVPLPAAQFTGLTVPVTFRVYTYQNAINDFADYDSFQLLGTVDAPNTPPTVGVFSSKSVVTAKSKLRLSGNAFDDYGVQSVSVAGRPAQGTNSWTASVRLKAGTNRIRIFATDTNGVSSSTVVVRVKRTSP